MAASRSDSAIPHQQNYQNQQQLLAEQQRPDYTAVSPLDWLRSSSYCITYLLYSIVCFALLLLLLLPAATNLASQSHGSRALVAATVLMAVVFSVCVVCHCCSDLCRLGGLQGGVGRLQRMRPASAAAAAAAATAAAAANSAVNLPQTLSQQQQQQQRAMEATRRSVANPRQSASYRARNPTPWGNSNSAMIQAITGSHLPQSLGSPTQVVMHV